MTALRIGINALYLIPGGVGGTEIYLRQLLAALARIDPVDEFFVFTNRETGTDLVPALPNWHPEPQAVRAVFRPARLAWEQTILPLAAARLKLNVLFNPGFTAPVVAPCPQATVFHDLQHKRHPEYFRWFDLPFWRVCLYLSAHRSRLLIAVSEKTAADLHKFYDLAGEKIRVVPHGVDPVFVEIARERACAAPERYFLCASTLHPHKGIIPLIRAFSEFRAMRPDFRLVITGVRGFQAAEVERTIAELGMRDTVRLTGWLPREELYGLFRRAYAFVYPSTFEGFGMPVIEALAAGVPSACSAIEPLKTLAGEAALLFAPNDESALRDALLRLADDEALRASLAAAGPVRASHFSWEDAAAGTLDALRTAARGC